MQKLLPLAVIGIVLIAALAGGMLLFRTTQSSSSNAQPTPQASAEPRKPGDDVVVTLEEFGDYQCPPCGVLHPTLKKLKQEFGSNLNFIFRNLPLTSIHKNALVAAQAAEAARIQNHFWEMHDLLYENQELWKDDINPKTIFVKFASDLGLDAARFAQDMDDKQVKLRIETDQEAAAQLGVNGTPTVIIDGRQVRPEATTPEGIRKGIEFIMRHKTSSP
jgi:protein-disulfide isomerase